VYSADHSALALLEILVQLERRRIPRPYQLLEIEAPSGVAIHDFGPKAPARVEESQAWGDDWLLRGETPLAKTPSAIAPKCFNFLINPLHAEAARIKLVAHAHYPWDTRLFS
jgi:RES domain-containing protein